jgi:hypothetical protein
MHSDYYTYNHPSLLLLIFLLLIILLHCTELLHPGSYLMEI